MNRIAVLTGGSTPERDVAFAGASQVVEALRASGNSVTVIDTVTGPMDREAENQLLDPPVGKLPPTPDELNDLGRRENLPEIVRLAELRAADMVFLVLHGRQGEGGELQALLDAEGLFYTGAGAEASALAMDKDATKRRLDAAGIPTQPWCVWPADPEAIESIGFPLVVKPSKVGSSVGLSVVTRFDELKEAVNIAKIYDDEVLLERLLPGREFTVGVLGDRALAVGEILPKHEIFDYECKYTPGMTDEIFPANVDDDFSDLLRAHALAAHQALGLRDFSRADFKQDADGVAQCLEVNTLPGLTATSLLPQSAAAIGIPFGALCQEICEMVLSRASKGTKKTPEVVD